MQIGDIRVFLADLAYPFLYEESAQYLHLSTLNKLNSVSHPVRKKQIIASRVILNRILSRYTHQDVSLYEDSHTGLLALNTNIAKQAKAFPYYWSISHTANYIGVALSRTAIGFDIEQLTNRRFVDIARFVFHTNEIQMIEQAINTNDMDKKFFETWTLREAIYKMTGWGPFERKTAVKTYLQDQQFFFCTQLTDHNLIYSLTSNCPTLCTVTTSWLTSLP